MQILRLKKGETMLKNKENLKNLYKDISQKNKILNMDKKDEKTIEKVSRDCRKFGMIFPSPFSHNGKLNIH